MPGRHRSGASGPGGRNVVIVFYLNSPFHLTYSIDMHMGRERETHKERAREPLSLA